MSGQNLQFDEAARRWAIRVRDPAFGDWDGLTEWLEQDSSHLEAYEAVLADEAWGVELLASAPAGASPELRPLRNWWLAGGAAAAAAVVVIGGWALLDRDAPARQIATAPGEHRTINLADGSKLALNGDTRVTIDPDKPRHVLLEQGEVRFEVRHDASDPFVVLSGGTRLVDAGTVFNVVQDGAAIEVAVSEGAVIFEPGRNEVRLGPGDTLRRKGKGAKLVRGTTDPDAIGSWTIGELQYDRPWPDQVARDLTRSLGRPIRASGGTGRLRFTGTLLLNGAPDEVLARAGAALEVKFVREGEGWTMSPTHGRPL